MSYEFMKYEINGNEYVFINEYWETRNAWGHKTRLFKNGAEISTNKVRYWNRTWEKFRYQSCMLGAIDNRQSYIVERGIANYKEDNNISRFKAGEKQELIDKIMEDIPYKELTELRKAVNWD